MTRWRPPAGKCRCGNAIRYAGRWCLACAKREADRRLAAFCRRRDGGRCQVPGCGSTYRLEWAHLIRRARAPSLRWTPDNATTLCHRHHAYFTHAGDGVWRDFVEEVLPGRWERLRQLERYTGRPDLEAILDLYGRAA